MYFWDSVGDFFHTSDSERKRNEYSKLVNLYSKGYQFAVNAVIDMIEQDMILARALQRGEAKW